MIRTKYVVGDVVTINGKQLVVLEVHAIQVDLYERPKVFYRMSDGISYGEGAINNLNHTSKKCEC